MTTDTRTLRGSLYAGGAMVAVGSSAAVAPLLTSYPLLAGQFWRYLVAGLILLLSCGRTAGPAVRPGRREWTRLVILAATGMAGFNICLLHAVRRADPSVVGAVVGAAPVVLAIIGPLAAARRPSARITLCAAATTVGVGLIQATGASSIVGLLWAAGALLCECCFSLLAVELLPRLGARRVSALAALSAAPMLATASALVEGRSALRWPTCAQWLALSYLTLVVTALAFLLWYAGIGLLGVDRAGLFAGVIPLTAVLLGPLLGTGRLSAVSVTGALLIGLAVLYGVSAPAAESRARPADPALRRS